MLMDMGGILRIILGLPFIIFIPGYVIVFALFPARKTDRGIDGTERIALSFGLSIAVVSLIVFGLNYMPGGIRLETTLLSLFVFVIGVGFIALYRWFKTHPDERLMFSLETSLPKSENKLDKALTIILVASIIIAAVLFIYIVVTPTSGEPFTAFYILDTNAGIENYPNNLNMGENATVIIGITNHEYQTINYVVEIWLINQTIVYNELANENETIYHNMWLMDKINVTLDHTSLHLNDSWEYNYTFNISKKGENLTLTFLLFTTLTENYRYDGDYRDIAEQKISDAYRETHLWIDVI